MKGLGGILAHIKNYRTQVGLSVFSNLMMVVFSVVSVPAIIPFLQVLFQTEEPITEKPIWSWDMNGMVDTCNFYLTQLIADKGRGFALAMICLILVSLFLLKNLFRYSALYFMAPVRAGMVRDIRSNLFNKIMHLPLSFYSSAKKGDIMSRVMSDVQEIETSIINFLEGFVRNPLMIIGSLGIMLFINVRLTLVVLILLAVAGFLLGRVGKSLRRKSTKVQNNLGNLFSVLDESLSGLRIVKSFSGEEYQTDQFNNLNDAYRKSLIRVQQRKDLASPLSEFLGIAIVASLLWYGGAQHVFTGSIRPEVFLAFLFAFYNVISPSKAFTSALFNIQKGLAANDRIQKILGNTTQLKIHEPIQSTIPTGDISFENVSFAYAKNEKVLTEINLTIPAGQTIAIVGPSGAGKSTLVDLIPRFYDLDAGTISIGGTDIATIPLNILRQSMGIVSQEPVLFNNTVIDNIAYGDPTPDLKRVKEAARAAFAHEFVKELPDGYQTILGDRGSNISGGQRQRITIARAIYSDPAILILDEATASLDSESEKKVQDALNELMKGRTSIVIAHRLSTIKNADKIVVLDKGRITQLGDHQALLHSDGIYKELIELQAFS